MEGVTVRHVTGGPVMTVQGTVGHLLLCMWMDDTGKVCRQTLSPNELVVHDAEHHTWMRVLVRLASRWPVAATC